VGDAGLAALSPSERAQVPDEIDRSDTAYEQLLREVFNQHPGGDGSRFENFYNVQLLWDEGMAEQAVEYLKAHPDHRMVVLAGSGHLARGSGIPRRLTRRLPVSSAIVLNGWEGPIEPDLADYILLTEPRTLPPAGTLGVVLDDEAEAPTVSSCLSDSPCKRAGLKRGDRLLSIDGEPVDTLSDLRVAMWNKQPGDTVILRVYRWRWFAAPQELSYTIELY
jgi:hypothetical protein